MSVRTVDTRRKSCDTAFDSDDSHDMPRGGYREGAGRKSAFGSPVDKPLYMDFTSEGHAALDRLRQQTGLSRNNILAHLAITHADDLEFDESGVVYPDKMGQVAQAARRASPDGHVGGVGMVRTIRLPKDAKAKLVAAHKRTTKSYSDLGEALVRRFGPRVKYWPVLPGKERKWKRKGRQ